MRGYDLYFLAIAKLANNKYFRFFNFYFHKLIQQRQKLFNHYSISHTDEVQNLLVLGGRWRGENSLFLGNLKNMKAVPHEAEKRYIHNSYTNLLKIWKSLIPPNPLSKGCLRIQVYDITLLKWYYILVLLLNKHFLFNFIYLLIIIISNLTSPYTPELTFDFPEHKAEFLKLFEKLK